MAKKQKNPPESPASAIDEAPKKRNKNKSSKKKVKPVPEIPPEDMPVPVRIGLIPQESEEPETQIEAASASNSGPIFRNKEKVLILCSRGIPFRFRHLMEDIITLLPHSKKDAKMEHSKENRASLLNEMADLKGCSSSIFFEVKKKKDLFFWISKTPNGPSAKFHVNAVHTMSELKLTGNHLKYSRPFLSFSPEFDSHPHLQLLKEMFTQVMGTPNHHRKSKPFFDHILTFSLLDGHIWFRNYQIASPNPGSTQFDKLVLEKLSLVEVGPRFCLNLIKIFGGSFGGVTLYQNPNYVSPNTFRSRKKQAKSSKYTMKVKAKARRKQHLKENAAEIDELADVWNEVAE